MKILLINPPIPITYYNREFYLPSGLLYLAAALQKNCEDEEIKILDLKTFEPDNHDADYYQKFYEKILIDTISNFKPEIIGLGCLYSGQFPDVLRFSKFIKEKFGNIPIVIGGIHPTIYPFEILTNCPSIDWIVMGEGEETIVQLVNTIKNNRYEFDKIDGFAFRKNGEVIVNPKKHFIEDPDSIPFPAYNLINLKDYYVDTSNWHNPKNLPINTTVPLITSRSCPYRCNFCSMFLVMGPKWRPRSPKNVVDEIEYMYNTYNHRHFSFMDDNLTLKKPHVLEICNLIIERGLNIQFETPNGLATSTLDEEVLDALVSAGMVRTSLAIESGSDYIRNEIMGKRLSREKIFEVANLTKKYNHLYVHAFFIIGMPEETHETLMETYDMIKKINVNKVYLHPVIPFPGTRVFAQALRDDLFIDLDPKDFYKSDNLYLTNYNRFFIKPYKLTLKDLQEFRAKCEKELPMVKKSVRTESPKNYT